MQDYRENLINYEIQLSKLEKFIEEISKITWNDETIISFYKKQIGLTDFSSILMGHIKDTSALNNLNYNDLKTRIKDFRQQCAKLQAENCKEYNEPYLTYISSYIANISNLINSFFETLNKSQSIENYYRNLLNGINQLQNGLNQNINELFEHFKYGNKNYVIFGKNGSGKTTLLNRISKDLFKNAVVIPANRTVMQSSNDYLGIHPKFSLNQMLADNISLTYLTRRMNNHTLKTYEKGKTDSLLSKFYNVYSSLGLDRNISVNDEFLYLQGSQTEKYSLDNGSDGGKKYSLFNYGYIACPCVFFFIY